MVGGGQVGERKVTSLLEAEATVRVISPEARAAIADLAARGAVGWERRGFRPGDTAGAYLVIAATNDPAVNQAVYEEADRAGGLVNVVDTPRFCNFISPAVVRRGPLAIAISTGGRSPALAKRVREEIEQVFPAEFADYIDDLVELRALLRDRVATPAGREQAWRELMAAGLLDLLRGGDPATARRLALAAADRVAAPDAGGAA